MSKLRLFVKIEDLKYLFFDMDGVLVLSEDLHFKAWHATLAYHDLPSDWMNFKEWIGISDTDNSKTIIERFDLDISIESLHQHKKQKFIDIIHHGFDSHYGRNRFLEKAKEHFQLALISSASRIEIEKITQHEQIAHHFEFCIGNEDVPYHKPHPLPYLKALEQAQIAPKEALIIEDSHSGIQAALSANIPVIALQSDAIIPDDIKQQVRFFEDFEEINKWLFHQS